MLKGGIVVLIALLALNVLAIDVLPSILPDTFDIKNPNHYIDYTAQLISKGELDSAKEVLDLGATEAQKHNNKYLQANISYYLADYFYYKQEYDTAHTLYNSVLPLFEELCDTLMIAKSLNSIGLLYSFEQNDEKTIHYYLLENALLNQVKNKNRSYDVERIVLLTNLINLHSSAKEHDKVIEHAKEGIKLAKEINDPLRLGSILNALAIAYKNIGDIDQSLKTFKEASALFRISKDDFRNSFIQNNIGGLYEQNNKNLDSALHYYQASLKGFNDEEYTWGITQSKLGVASVLSKKKKFTVAEKHYNSVIDTSINHNFNKVLLLAYQGMAQLKYDSKSYKQAFEYNRLYDNLNDSLFNQEKHKQYAELQTKYEINIKENEINNLKTEKLQQELILEKSQLHKQIIISFFLFALVSIVVLVVYYIQKRRDNRILQVHARKIEHQNEQLKTMNHHIRLINNKLQKSRKELSISNTAKNKFFSILAHDLRNPFHNILGQSYLLSETFDKLSSDEKKQYAVDIYKSCDQVNRLLENLLEWSRSQSKGLNFNPQKLKINELVLNSISVLKYNALAKDIIIENNIQNNYEIVADKDMVETIFRNIVNNSIKFTTNGGTISLSAIPLKNKIKFIIQDTGVGICKKELEKIFNLDSNFKTRGTNGERGTGLGLVICKEFIKIHKGEIWAESELNDGSKFFIELPLT
ncbi:MAG: ATP-binding protein [Prolixibacteraceae bacterium]|jgi:signal transduction histidine kinase/tetratricopeptide (TPR) repeat protein|nr:ATP-binding protein [Prolixibacteraceae bacterium]